MPEIIHEQPSTSHKPRPSASCRQLPKTGAVWNSIFYFEYGTIWLVESGFGSTVRLVSCRFSEKVKVKVKVRRKNEVILRWARLVLGWVTVFGPVYHVVCNQANYRSTQPSIPLGALNQVAVSIGQVKVAGSTLLSHIWHASFRSGEAYCKLLYALTFTSLYLLVF